MEKIISFNRAVQLSLLLFGLFIVFHLAIIVGIIAFNYVPIDFLWGGRMETREELLNFEIISLVVMAVCFLIVLIRAGKVNAPKLLIASRIALWILVVLFLLNTVGNILAKTTFEKFFGVFTVLLALLCLRLAIERTSVR